MPSVKQEMDMLMEMAFVAGFKAGRQSSDPIYDLSNELMEFMKNPEKYASKKCYGCGKKERRIEA